MSKLYNNTEYNVCKINSLYKEGFTLYKNTRFISQLNGSVTLEWLAGGIRANDYQVNFSSEIKEQLYMYWSPGYDVIIKDLYNKFVQCPSIVQKLTLPIQKNNTYNVDFNPRDTGLDFDKNNVAIRFGEKFLHSNSGGERESDQNLFRNYFVNVSPSPNKPISSMSGCYYDFNVGDTYHIESVDRNNPYFIGDCDVKITYKHKDTYYIDPMAPPFYFTLHYQITNISRQPSQIITEPRQYLKIKFNEDVVSLFEDIFA